MSIDVAWSKLNAQGKRLKDVHLRQLFDENPGRVGELTFEMDDLLVDFSKEKLDREALDALVSLAEIADVAGQRDRMAKGDAINSTEQRAVLHMALRGSVSPSVPGVDEVSPALERMLAFTESVRLGDYAAPEGPFTDIVNIGIGGSDLGPVMAARALRPDNDGPALHFVSNVDGAHLTDVVAGLDPRRTLVVVASKTFTTMETMANARSIRAWLADALGEDRAGAHLVAVSTNIEACGAFGIPESRVFGFWDWVGGRYSVWSAVGLSVAIGIGADRFRAFLDGAADMDRHFLAAPFKENLPVLLALVGIWRRNVMGWPSVALIPYDQRLERFPAYVQQLDMESNGKRITRSGESATVATGPVIWGEAGTNSQHSFFQLLHQGTDVVPVDFILAANPRERLGDHHAFLQGNALAQSAALAFGRTEDEVRAAMSEAGRSREEIDALAAHRTFPGDRPSTTILYDRLDPYALGRLIALYEHKVFVQGAIWGINSFDQWGVELGKELAQPIIEALRDRSPIDGDASTNALVQQILRRRS